MRHISWVIKVSKLCNLRCRYCYEWNDLAKRDRISLEQWRELLIAIRNYHRMISRRTRRPLQSHIIWHGGEPLLLPVKYIQSVMQLQREVLGSRPLALSRYVNFLQTNLYAVEEEKLDLLKKEGINVGLSMDLVGGVRLTAGGAETEARVARHMDMLLDRDIGFGAIVVVAKHTSPHLTSIYDFYEALGINVRFLPLFDAPLNTPEASFAISHEEMLCALKQLCVHWMSRPRRMEVSPFHEYLQTVLLRMVGRSQRLYDRRRYGEYTLLVNTDGTLYQRIDAYDPDKALGNVFKQSIEEICASPAYSESLERDEHAAFQHCKTCEYSGACNRSPLFESPRRDVGNTRCRIAYPLYLFMEQYVRERGYTARQLGEFLGHGRQLGRERARSA